MTSRLSPLWPSGLTKTATALYAFAGVVLRRGSFADAVGKADRGTGVSLVCGKTAAIRLLEAVRPAGAKDLGLTGAAGITDSRLLLGGKGGGVFGEPCTRVEPLLATAIVDDGGGGGFELLDGGVGGRLFRMLVTSEREPFGSLPSPDFKSAVPRARTSARMSLPASLAVSAARFSQRNASSRSPLVQKMSAVSSAETTSSLSLGSGLKMLGSAVIWNLASVRLEQINVGTRQNQECFMTPGGHRLRFE